AAAIDSREGAFAAAVVARDSNAILGFYASDARLLPPGMPRADSLAGVRRIWSQMLAIPELSLSLQSSEVISSEGGDLAIDLGTYRTTAQGPAGKAIVDIGKYVTIFRRIGGGREVIVDTVNS